MSIIKLKKGDYFKLKNNYREFFTSIKSIIKFAPFLDELGINRSAFCRFLKNDNFDYEVSSHKLSDLKALIIEKCTNLLVK